MTQIAFRLSDAHEALDQFLASPEGGSRWIGDGKESGDNYGKPLAYIVSAEGYDELSNGHRQWLEAEEVRDYPVTEYRPWIHSPLADTDRLLPTEPLYDTLARAIFGKPYDELADDSKDQWKVRATAVACLLEVQFDPDGQGAVPVMTLGHDQDDPGRGLRWRIAFRTAVRGLFLRVTGNGFLGEEWGICTGSGYVLSSGWCSRDDANSAAEALGRTLPNADWMRLTPDGFTPAAKTAIRAVLKRYHVWGLDEKAPEPEVLTDQVPAPTPG